MVSCYYFIASLSIRNSLLVFAILLKHKIGDLVQRFHSASVKDHHLSLPTLSYETFHHLLREDLNRAETVTEFFDRD